MIVDRGEVRVIRRLANNAGARFSESGYSGIVARAGDDDELTEILGLRIDLPGNACATWCAGPRTPCAPGS